MSQVRFVFMTDCQLGCYATFSGLDDQTIASYRALGMRVAKVPLADGVEWDAVRLRVAVEQALALDPDMVVMGGDMIDDPSHGEQLDELMRITEALDGLPLHWVAGNHDVAFDATVPSPESMAWYRERFGPDRYAFRRGVTSFIVVDTTLWHRPEKVGAEVRAQEEFLESALSDAADSENLILFGHHPPFVESHDEPDSYWNIPLEYRTPLLERLSGAGGCTWFAGHYHRNATARHGDVEVVVSGPVGYPLGDDPSGIRLVEAGADGVRHRYLPLQLPTESVDR